MNCAASQTFRIVNKPIVQLGSVGMYLIAPHTW